MNAGIVVSGGVLVALGLLAQGGSQRFDIAFSPLRGPDGMVTTVRVHEIVTGGPTGKRLGLIAAVADAGVTRIADRIIELSVSDRQGSVPLRVEEDGEQSGGTVYYRHWYATRDVTYPVTVQYEAVVQPAGSPDGPSFGIRPSGGGFAGAGSAFLLLPENGYSNLTHLHWDLEGLAPGSIGVISSGEGAVDLSGPPSRLNEQWMMAGPAVVSRSVAGTPVTGYTLGQPPFDAGVEMLWIARAYRYLAQSFRYLDPPPPYRVFIKTMTSPPYGGGSAMPWPGGGFLMGIGTSYRKGQDVTQIHETFFHEMTHQWTGHMDEDATWFSEGLTVCYSVLLPLRGGLETVEQYGRAIDDLAKYYRSSFRHWTEEKINQSGFGNEEAREIPYRRGALYFIDLDAKLRARIPRKNNFGQGPVPAIRCAVARDSTDAAGLGGDAHSGAWPRGCD
jgi:hypothetical protein